MGEQTTNKTRKHKKTVIILSVFVAVLLFAAGVFLKLNPQIYSSAVSADYGGLDNYVKFIDCSMADCMLIKSGEHTALIDTGDIKDNAAAVLSSLKKSNIPSFDYVFISHPHTDHLGGVAKILENYKVNTAVIPPIEEFTQAATEIASLTYKTLCEKCECVTVAPGQRYTVGEFTVDIIYYSTEFEDINDHSAVYRVSAYGKTLLTMGDSGFETEDELLYGNYNIKADFYKMSHHGSDTSNDYGFISAVDPAVIVCSAGYSQYLDDELSQIQNSFKNTAVLSTYKNGDITICFEKEGYSIKTGK